MKCFVRNDEIELCNQYVKRKTRQIFDYDLRKIAVTSGLCMQHMFLFDMQAYAINDTPKERKYRLVTQIAVWWL